MPDDRTTIFMCETHGRKSEKQKLESRKVSVWALSFLAFSLGDPQYIPPAFLTFRF